MPDANTIRRPRGGYFPVVRGGIYSLVSLQVAAAQRRVSPSEKLCGSLLERWSRRLRRARSLRYLVLNWIKA